MRSNRTTWFLSLLLIIGVFGKKIKFFLLLPKNGSTRGYLERVSQQEFISCYYLNQNIFTMKNQKLTVLDFKKEELVNLNDEDMMAIKGGYTSGPCVAISLKIYDEVKQNTKEASWWKCEKPTPNDQDFFVSQIQYPEATCASIPPLVIEVY